MATVNQNDIIMRLRALLPAWFADQPVLSAPPEKQSRTVLNSLLTGLANAHSSIIDQLSYAKLQTRILTATDGWLDMIAADFFGNALVRVPGQSDKRFLGKIRLNMFRERGTRHAVSLILQDLTGRPPIIFEPARAADTGGYGGYETISIVGVPQIYKSDWQGNQLQYATARTNSLNYTIALNLWTRNTMAVLPNTALAPDGTFSMDLLINTGATDCFIQQQVPIAPNSTNIFSIFVKQGTSARARLRVPYVVGTTYDTAIDFDFATGQWVAGYAASITPSAPVNLGNGIWRLAAAFTDTGSNTTADVRVAPANATSTQTIGDTLYVWGADFKRGTSVLSSYIPSVDAVTSRASAATCYNSSGVLQTVGPNVARYGYDPATLVSQGLIIEAAATNLALQSQTMSAAPWSYINSTGNVVGGRSVFLAPDGTNSAILWNDGTAASVPHTVVQLVNITAGGVYNFSIYAAQAAGLRYITLHIDDNIATGLYAIFDLQTGAIAAPISVSGTAVAGFATITPVNTGWYRCSISGICSTTATTARIAVSGGLTANPSWYEVYTGANNGVYLWGAQFEAGYVPSSYIATTTTAATRAADVAASTARTIADYSITASGVVTFATAPAYNATLSWTGTEYSAMLGQNVKCANTPFAVGDGATTSWQIMRPYGFGFAYDMLGGYASLNMPMQAMITAYRPMGLGIPNVGGYGSPVMGYGVASQGVLADLSMMQTGVSDADIYAAIDSVRPATSILWTRIVNSTVDKLDYNFVLDQSTLSSPNVDVLDTSFVLDQSTLQSAPPAYLDQNFTLDTSELN